MLKIEVQVSQLGNNLLSSRAGFKSDVSESAGTLPTYGNNCACGSTGRITACEISSKYVALEK